MAFICIQLFLQDVYLLHGLLSFVQDANGLTKHAYRQHLLY